VVMPACFGLVYLALPLRTRPRLPHVTVGLVAVAIVLQALGLQISANFAKFAAITAAGFLFVRFFEALSWVVLVAVIIPWVDAYSVWRGPTKTITEHHAGVFTRLSVAFVVPGGNAARLGLPDILFFAVFLAASARFGLRPLATWICMVVGLGLTMSVSAFWMTSGLPALPAIALGFLIPNADLIWQRLRSGRAAELPGS
jgi:hypothetical protein